MIETIPALFDSGSMNSWIDSSLEPFVTKKWKAPHQTDTLLGSEEMLEGEAWSVKLYIPSTGVENATLIKSRSITIPSCKNKRTTHQHTS